MKNLARGLLAMGTVGLMGWAGSGAQAQTAPKEAVLVIRHAEDADKWASTYDAQPADKKATAKPWPSTAWAEVCPTWPEYQHPYDLVDKSGAISDTSAAGFKVPVHGLSGVWEVWGADGHKDGTKASMKKRDANGNVVKDGSGNNVLVSRTVPYLKDADGKDGEAPLGEFQAVKLAEKLDEFLAKNGFAKVNRAITMNPQDDNSGSAPTPNPFDTIWPYLKKRQTAGDLVNLILVKRKVGNDMSPGLKAIVTGESGALPLTKDGSTLICWTGEAIETREEKGLLEYLAEKYRPDHNNDWTKQPTSRCADLVVYYKDPADGQGVIERWMFDATKGTFTLRETKPSEKARPQG